MEELLAILNDIEPDVDYGTAEDLIDGHRLDSLAIISLIAELEETFDVTVPAVEIVPENFNSAQRILDMVTRLQEEG